MLKNIEKGVFNVNIDPGDIDFLRKLNIDQVFINNSPLFRDVKVITRPFYDAIISGSDKLLDSDILNMPLSGRGSFMHKNEDGVRCTYCFDFKMIDNNFSHLTFFSFHGNHLKSFTDLTNYYIFTDCVVEIELVNDNKQYWVESLVMNEVRIMIEYFIFCKYAQIEERVLSPKEKFRDKNCKYFNDSKSNITILNSAWFTNLVKSDAFKVRGHFRLQPKKKDGEWTKELIWINDFQKEGYTAPARKLKED